MHEKSVRSLAGVIRGLSYALLLIVTACGSSENPKNIESPETKKRALDLSDPIQSSMIRTKIMGSIAEEETHSYLRFHIYGFLGENSIPFFSMNNYVVQKWTPQKPGYYELQHYEVGYFTAFDSDTPIETWENPITGETVELENFILGPITRLYTPEGVIAPGLAPQPLNVSVVGDRIFLPAQTIESFPNMFTPEEWPTLSSGPTLYWDSMYTFSAPLAETLDSKTTTVQTEIHMQNLVSWSPFLEMGQRFGRTMARAYGGDISGFDALDANVRAGFEKYTPEIFETETWKDVRFDSLDYYQKKLKEREREEKQ